MPEVHFIGTLDIACGSLSEMVSITWSIIPGNSDWYLQKGLFYGETHAAKVSDVGETFVLNHPIDVQYNTSCFDGWPCLVCEVWDRTEEGTRGLLGCGCVWLPTTGGKSNVEIVLWKPMANRLLSIQNISDNYLPSTPDLVALRDLTIDEAIRSTTKASTVGIVSVTMFTLLTKDFRQNGVNI